MKLHAIIAIVAVLAGGAAVIFDHYNGFQQLPAGGETPATGRMDGQNSRGGYDGVRGNVKWSRLFINGPAASQAGDFLNVSTLSIMGTNVSDKEVKLDEAYFLSGLEETKLKAHIGRGGGRYNIEEMRPLPPGALFFIVSDPLGRVDAGLSQSEFLKNWARISFVARYDGTTQTIEFDRQTVEVALPKPAKP
jgi:hypothetical protein